MSESEVKISFKVLNEKKYQEGLVSPFAISKFNIKEYLFTPKIVFKFDVNSYYSELS